MNRDMILDYLKAHREDIVRDLTRLARIPSVQSAAEPGAPFGRECARCLSEAAALYRENGFDICEYPESGYNLCIVGEGEKTLGLFAHMDVVPVNEADWLITRPFDILEKDGFLIGRGVSDNKSGAIAALYLLKSARDLNIPFKNRLMIFMGSNEESGMQDMQHFVREQTLPDAALVPDGGFPFSLGEKGILRLDLTFNEEMQSIVSLHGGDAYNTVMPELQCRLHAENNLKSWLSSHAQDWLDVSDEGDTLLLTAHGLAAHAAHPTGGDSALRRLCALLCQCDVLAPIDRRAMTLIAEALSDSSGQALGIADHAPVLGDLTSANGMVRMTSNKLMFTLDIRHGETITGAEIVQKIRARLEPSGVFIAVHGDSNAFIIPEDQPLVHALLSAYRETTGNEQARPFYMDGGTYSKYLVNAFTTGASTSGDISVLNLPAGHGRAHASDECVCIDGLIDGISVICVMAQALDKTL